MLWSCRSTDSGCSRRLSHQLGLTESTASLLCQMGFSEPSEASDFLSPSLTKIEDPFEVTHVQDAVKRIRLALARDEDVLIFGDYDVDGVTSTAFLVDVLQLFGMRPRYIVPLRLEEGYGLSEDALERALADGKPNLLIAVDCGTSSSEAVTTLRKQGIDVIILDHHTSKDDLPQDCILVNPHVHDSGDRPWSHLCAVGIVFKFIHALLKELRLEGDELAHEIRLRNYLDLVALGTIADLVPLLGENRILAKEGLRLIRNSRRIGLCALLEVSGLSLGTEVTPFDISFRLGPRINASGRLDDASRTIDLFLSDDWQFCRATAKALDDINRERQDIERSITEGATAQVETMYRTDPGLILFNPEWHAGVVGIVASRIAQKYHRPVIVLGEDSGLAKGSGRSVEGINLVDVLKSCRDYLVKWGGHPMAVGLSAREHDLSALRGAFNASIIDHVQGDLPEKTQRISLWVTPEMLTEKLLEELELLSPFGQGNPEPVFGLRQVQLRSVTPFGNGHFRFNLDRHGAAPISGVAWKLGHRIPAPDQLIDIAVRFSWNVWQGRKTPRLTLINWR